MIRMLQNMTPQHLSLSGISFPFDVFPKSVVNFDYKWRENVVNVTYDVIDIKGAVR